MSLGVDDESKKSVNKRLRPRSKSVHFNVDSTVAPSPSPTVNALSTSDAETSAMQNGAASTSGNQTIVDYTDTSNEETSAEIASTVDLESSTNPNSGFLVETTSNVVALSSGDALSMENRINGLVQ